MKYDEISSAIAVGATKSMVVFPDRPIWARGYVRTVSVHSENRVQVALDVEGMESVGDAAASADHGALETAVRDQTILFPPGAEFQLQECYWSQFLPGVS